MKNRSGEKIKLASIDELLGVVNEESAMEIEISKIHPFKNHPFKVLDDEKMQDLVESVKINGVLTPVLLRMDENEEYEMVSGHRRMHAAQLAGLTTIPAIVRELSDDDAIVAMVDANIQREELLPSEKAFAYKMKLDAMKRQGSRTDLTLCQSGTKSRTDQLLGEQVGESARSVQRYIRLTELIPELLDLVDNKKLQFTVAVDISYIDKEVQEWIYEYISDTGFIKPMVNESKKQIERMDIFVETMRKMSSLDTRELVAEEITSKQVEIDVRAEMNVFRKKFGKLYELECSETEEKFSGDKEVILEVIENLLSNAFRYAKTKVEMEVFLTCSELQIRIKDDGVGFTIDKQKATELFYQQNVKDSLKHSGMGMYISRLYCEKHGGQLLIENEKQSGAVITAVFHRIA